MREMYKRYEIVAGKTRIIRKTETSRIKTEKGKRKPKTNPTPEAVAKINKINQERDLTVKLNTNFKAGDTWLTLSYPEKLPIEECMKAVNRFKRNIRAAAKRKGIPFRLIESTGIGQRSGKPHHHIVLNKEITRDMIIKYWPEEQIYMNSLWKSGNYRRIAKYMLKNAYQSKGERGKHTKAYRCSAQIETPDPRVRDLKRPVSYDPEDLKAHDGYAIDRDSIRVYDHPITGVPCIEYIEVSLTEEPKIKYARGRKVKPERIYKEYQEEQLFIDQLEF